jgi:hypothetical protein
MYDRESKYWNRIYAKTQNTRKHGRYIDKGTKSCSYFAVCLGSFFRISILVIWKFTAAYIQISYSHIHAQHI